MELGNRIDKLEQKIPTIEQQISAIDESITLLKQTDEALRAKDEQLATEDEKLNMAIQELEILITDLKKYVIDPGLSSTKDWAEATFYTLKQYNAAVSTLAKLEQSIASSDDATSKEISDAISALQASFQTWVGKELSGYYSIARADAEFAALRQSIGSGDQTLQGEIDAVELQIANSATELEKEYQAAIETAIEEYNGTITAELKSKLDDVNKRIDEQVAAINDKLDALEAQIDKNSEDIAKLLTRIQSLSYVHKYADGKAKMVCTSDFYSSRLSFEVSPKDAVTELEKVWKDIVSAKALGQGIGEEQFVSLPVQLVEADAQSGIITLQLSGTKLPAPIATASEEIQVAVQISDGNTAIVSDYIPVVKSKIEDNVFIYTTKDGNIFEPIADAFDANIVSNTYNKEENIGVISFDSPITSINSIVYLADEETTIDGYDNITSIIIPNSVTSIGERAFQNCPSLTSVTIPDDVTSIEMYAFSGCTSLTSIIIPNSVTSIGGSCFYNCTSLTSITIPDSVTSIGHGAFSGCTSLESIAIPDDVTYIGMFTFNNCTSLTSVTIPDSVTEIGDYAFQYCTSLTSVTIPDSVTSIGSYAFQYCTSLTNVTMPDSVTEIGRLAFLGCTSLESVTIPDSVTYIGRYAFYDCTSLTNVYIHSIIPPGDSDIFENAPIEAIYVYEQSVSFYKEKWSKYADKIFSIGPKDEIVEVHYDCGGKYIDFNQLNNLIIKGVSSNTIFLEKQEYYNFDYAFADNEDLRSITLPEGVTSLTGTFKNCTSLESVIIPDCVTEIGDYAFYYCDSLTSVTIPDSVTSIGSYAFYYCDSLTSITIPDGVTTIGDSAFYYCDSLTSITIPDSVTEIGEKAFLGCTSLGSVTIPNGVTSIRDQTFQYCRLTSITIPDSVTSIGEDAFNSCWLVRVYISDIAAWCRICFDNYYSNPLYYAYDLYLNGKSVTNLVIPDGVTEIGSYSFSGYTSLTSVTIPDSVTEIGDYAFYYCDSLTSVTIPDSVTSIGSYAFEHCYSLTSITIPDGVTTIGDRAFCGCDSLESVTIPYSVTTIGDMAFNSCGKLREVYCKRTTPPSIGENAFYDNAYIRRIYVPTASVKAYKSALNWSDYSSVINGYNF